MRCKNDTTELKDRDALFSQGVLHILINQFDFKQIPELQNQILMASESPPTKQSNDLEMPL